MAEHKYDLLVQEKGPINYASKNSWHVKWHNERMKTRYIKHVKPGKTLQNYDTKNWLFLKRGLDDFRVGLPPIIQDKNGIGSALHKDFVPISGMKEQAALKHLSKYRTYLTRDSVQKQQIYNYINGVEQGLLTHPLALYPHLEKSVASEIFENILDILDPQFSALEFNEEELDMFGNADGEYDNTPQWGGMGAAHPAEEEKPKMEQTLGIEPSFRNMYRWLPQKENVKDSKRNKEKEKVWPSSQSEEEHIKQITQEFCDWVSDLGGETNNIEESTITSLFASGYDTKPALSVPIHVVDLANVPHELRLSAMVPPPAPPEKQASIADIPKKKVAGGYDPTFVKFRYGAWYLNPNTWRKMGFYESLEDPKQLKEHEMSEAKTKCHDLTEELASMHASKAFDDFIGKRNTRKPEFLAEIANIQKKTALEAAKRAESELLVKQKKHNSKQKENVK
uniref:Uncharacterized protein n=1 Tax=Arion vulgaris TaxID=1028688 RepID=A0A0B7BW95_9EUPU